MESLKTAQAKLKSARQSLLKAAFEGKLTEQWRKENADQLESPETLLERIQAEREAHYQRQLADWQRQFKDWETAGQEGKKPRKPKAPKALPPLTQEELAELPELPEGWDWIRTADLLEEEPRNGKSVKDAINGFPVLRLTALRGDSLNLDAKKEGAWSRDEAFPYLVKEEDFFIARGNGSKALVGAGCLAKGIDREIAYPDTMIRLRPAKERLDPKYLNLAWRSIILRRQIERSARTTAGIYKINQQQVSHFILPLPSSIAEQKAISKKLESRLSQLDQLEQTLAASLKQAEALKQSILKRAFAGKLVPQDPSDEPASELLARIRAERESRPKSRRRKSGASTQ
ncbi:hypothetical protein ACPF7Z_12275 [Halomonas sp. GXIMD04776]|uniref:restriction endonuclease subunit S n=1 Tax=Halomonas sp. GXIMD04776 TaxID=3415605 RepID=UPI003C9C5F61